MMIQFTANGLSKIVVKQKQGVI